MLTLQVAPGTAVDTLSKAFALLPLTTAPR